MSEHLSLRLRVSGRVQGVGYRYWAETEAERLKLSGWVRNRSDGSVEMVICGPADVVRTFVANTRRGPPAAQVARIEESTDTVPGSQGFRVLPTL